MCRVLEVSTSGYYAWRKRAPSERALVDMALTERILEVHERSRGTYGAPRVHAELQAQGLNIGRKRVARLMRQAGIRGVSRRRRVGTTRRRRGARPAPDLVNRDLTANRPNQLWVADITHVPTRSGILYLAVVLDVWSRRIVGWAMASHMRESLVQAALDMAVTSRRLAAACLIHHSDQGSQYTALAFGERCKALGIDISMGSVGDCYDNAMCESFFATLECELLDRRTFSAREEAASAIFDFIEGWYNPHRRHSALNYMSPVEFEATGQQERLFPVERVCEPVDAAGGAKTNLHPSTEPG
jgi:putative transposase